MVHENQISPWSFFDKIYCISIVEREDRRQAVGKEFERVGLAGLVEFVLVDKHPENREQGIFESHIICLKKGLASGAEKILVFEDDVFFYDYQADKLLVACAKLDDISSWDGLLLGGIIRGCSRLGNNKNDLWRVRYRCLTHAYCVQAKFARFLVQQPWSGVPIDTFMKKQNPDFYAPARMFAFQGKFDSDNQTAGIAFFRRLFGGMFFLQRLNEFYHHNKPVLWLSHILLLLLLFFLPVFFF